ncbi:MAG: hypothetical protein WAN30_05815 [Acidimicrobiales bacterium]
MAKSATGKWVSRVGSSGGGKAYKKSRPSNYYGILIVIVVLGLVATALARYDYQHPSKGSKGAAPAVGTTWYGALAIEACGTQLPYLTTDPTNSGGFKVETDNVIKLDPVSAADSGANATLAQFANEYPGLIASSVELAIPTSKGTANAATTYRNGQSCPSTSKYSGQSGQVEYAYWTSLSQTKPVITTNPGSIKFAQYLRVTLAFDPKGVTPAPPSQTTVNAMSASIIAAVNTTTTTAASVTTTTPTVNTTTTSSTTTTTTKG